MDSKKRSLIKAISWRFTATVTTVVIVLVATGNIGLSLSVGLTEVLLKFLIYYGHERAWNNVQWGRNKPKL